MRTGAAAAATIAAAAALAVLLRAPMLFPSLGPTVFLLYSAPLQPAASPRNTVVGHLIGAASGYCGLAVTGLVSTPADLWHVTWPRVGAAAVALGLTALLMSLGRVPHPPAGATTLIVALGLLGTPQELAAIPVGVALVTAVAVALNRAAGIAHPLWAPADPD